jgi:hypothetical protein|tara:strand:- start:469 stop:1161 length:693 start_codon:yes stop_codon:yes gene_type:complete
MYNVAIYGHITLDRIFDNFKKDCSIGSIGNVWKYLNRLNPNLKIYIEPTDIGEAMIFINRHTNERASIANLSLKCRKPTLKESQWNHIMYLNELNDISYIKDIKSGIVSADVCRGRVIEDFSILKYVDFLFLSDEDEFCDPKRICKFLKKGLILHHSLGSSYYHNTGEKIDHFKVKQIDGVNVLGCGDMLVSGFIDYYLKNKNVIDALQKSHDAISTYLNEQKEKNNGKS